MRPISPEQEFEALRADDALYVDKTEVISELISMKRVFFSRPRRFGKSMTLSTIGTLFEEGVEPYFKDTWIYDKWTDVTYPVLRINCMEFSTAVYDNFITDFCEKIKSFAKRLEIDLNPARQVPGQYMADLFEALPKGQRIVILVDEYDCVLTRNINNETEYKKYTECLQEFYGVLKASKHIRFLGITGVTRLKNVSIFSVASNITDASYDSKIATLTGYTRDEILANFKDYILYAVNVMNGTHLTLDDITAGNPYVKDFLDRLASEYDGYCFDEDYRKKVYSTWSVNNFFIKNTGKDQIRFGDYWFDNGGMPSILRNYLESHDLDVTAYTSQEMISPDYDEFMSPTSLLDITPSVLMCQTGYLTLKSELRSGYPLLLGIPNNEVRKALANRLFFKFAKRNVALSNEQRELLEHGSTEEIFELFNALFGSASYERYPVRDEATLRYPLQCFFMGAGLSVVAEHQNSRGRSDLELEFKDRRIVIELKYVETAKEADKALEQAVSQIKECDYGNTLPLKQELMRLAMVFDGSKEERRFVRCAAI